MLCRIASMAYLNALACKAALVHPAPTCHASASGADKHIFGHKPFAERYSAQVMMHSNYLL